jgi:hypothetical protein
MFSMLMLLPAEVVRAVPSVEAFIKAALENTQSHKSAAPRSARYSMK